MESKSTPGPLSPEAKSNNSESKTDNQFDSDSDEDFIVCTTSSPKKEPLSHAPNKLNFSLVSTLKESKDVSVENLEKNRHEKEISINFELPDASSITQVFKIGQTVEVLKAYICEEVDMEMGEQSLFVNDKLLLDPMSLLDYPEFVDAVDGNAEEVFVRVEGEMGEELRK